MEAPGTSQCDPAKSSFGSCGPAAMGKRGAAAQWTKSSGREKGTMAVTSLEAAAEYLYSCSSNTIQLKSSFAHIIISASETSTTLKTVTLLGIS